MVRLDVTAGLAGMNTTQAVVKALPELNGQNLKRMLRNGDIRLNGSRIKKDFETAEGDIIEVYMPDGFRSEPVFDICYEDRNILILNKQPGSIIRCEPGDPGKDLLSLVLQYMIDEGEYIEELGCIPFALDSFDVNTGGLTLFAKNAESFDYLRIAARQRRIRRVFQAIVSGRPTYDSGEFQHFYLRDGHREKVTRQKVQGAVPMYTRYKVLRSSGTYSLIELDPVTGFANQERAHLQAAGYPILGDPVYGDPKLNRKTGIRYQALWSTEIAFSTGVNNILEYLNGRRVRTNDILFPLVNLADE